MAVRRKGRAKSDHSWDGLRDGRGQGDGVVRRGGGAGFMDWTIFFLGWVLQSMGWGGDLQGQANGKSLQAH